MSEDENIPGTSHRHANKETCAICLNNFTNQEIGKPETCDHTFCLDCIIEWSAVTNTCPIDRIQFRSICVKHNLIGKILKKVPVKVKHNENDELLDEDRTFCEICGQANREDRLLLCDGCDKGFHLECLTPPLQDIPVDEWFCAHCAPRYKQRIEMLGPEINESFLARGQLNELGTVSPTCLAIKYSSEEDDEEESSNSIQSVDDEGDEGLPNGFNSGDYLFSSDDDNDDILYSLTDENLPSASSPRKRRIVSRTTRRRKTRRCRKSSSKKRIEKSKKGRRRKGRRRRKSKKGRKKSALRRTHSEGEIDDQLSENAKIRGRLASTLNIVVPSKKEVGASLVPKVREPYKEPTVLPGPKLSLLGNNYDLLDFDDGTSSEDDSGLVQEANREQEKKCESLPNDDILASIMADQNLLHTPSSSIVIRSDGSLEAKSALHAGKVVSPPAVLIDIQEAPKNPLAAELAPSSADNLELDLKRKVPKRRSRWSDEKLITSDNAVINKHIVHHMEQRENYTANIDTKSSTNLYHDSPDPRARTQIRNADAKPRMDSVPPPNSIFQGSSLANVLPFTLTPTLSNAERFLIAGNQQQAAVDALLLAHVQQQQQLGRFLQPMAFANVPFTLAAATAPHQRLTLQQVLAQQQVNQTGLIAPNFIVNNLAAANVNSMLDLATFAALQQPPPPPPPLPPVATTLSNSSSAFNSRAIRKMYVEPCLPVKH
uniref:PHD and RING finger domain-containing protein 1 n=1 Tax=Romanomermis culicivorax TaxID=13658 RepID=A0A915KTT9_ROMCU